MAASFRNAGEILELIGVDLFTISPSLLKELNSSKEKIEKKLDIKKIKELKIEKKNYNESTFR
jgi:transaldolase